MKKATRGMLCAGVFAATVCAAMIPSAFAAETTTTNNTDVYIQKAQPTPDKLNMTVEPSIAFSVASADPYSTTGAALLGGKGTISNGNASTAVYIKGVTVTPVTASPLTLYKDGDYAAATGSNAYEATLTLTPSGSKDGVAGAGTAFSMDLGDASSLFGATNAAAFKISGNQSATLAAASGKCNIKNLAKTVDLAKTPSGLQVASINWNFTDTVTS